MNRYMIRQAPARLSTISGYYRPNGWAASTRFGGAVSSRRWESTDLGEDQSGHISAGPNEGILFFDNLYMPRIHWIKQLKSQFEENLPELVRRFQTGTLGKNEPEAILRQAIPESVPIKVTSIIPRRKDGGAFVKFSHPKELTASDVESLLRNYLRENPIRPWWSPFRRLRTTLVQGQPWLEDLYRFPSSRLKVEFVSPSGERETQELSQEALYSLFRRYGKLAEITSQPADSKTLPRYALVDFAGLRNATVAKNCMHGFTVSQRAGGGKGGTQIRLSYELKRTRFHFFWEWLMNHPRVTIPVIAVIVGTVTVAIFDPVRTFFIKAHITHSFDLTENRFYKWFKNQATDIFTFRHRSVEEAGLSAIWDDRKEVIEQVRTWLMETADTFIVVQGPRGSGKKELILDQALKNKEDTLVIDCRPIQEARGDGATIAAAAKEVGYRPIFSWMNSASSLVDLAAQGTIGVKSGFSETLDAQLAKIWQSTAIALKLIALEGRSKHDKDANLSDDDYLEAHPEVRPVVVIDNFLHKNEESSIVYDKLSEWAARLTTTNIAHVIFLTNDISYSKSLSKALPDRVFRQIALGDITPEVAKKYVITQLDADDGPHHRRHSSEKRPPQPREDLSELDECIGIIGGRLTDLEFLARRLKTGQTPKKAVEEMIQQSASEIIKMYLLDMGDSDAASRRWSSEQAWHLISSLAKSETLRYNEVLLSNTFAASLTGPSSGEAVLEALSQAELISIKTINGHPQAIKAGKLVYQAAFKQLNEDLVLRSKLDMATLVELQKIETKKIDKFEAELTTLATLNKYVKAPQEIVSRTRFLLAKLEASQKKIDEWEYEIGALKKVLSKEMGAY